MASKQSSRDTGCLLLMLWTPPPPPGAVHTWHVRDVQRQTISGRQSLLDRVRERNHFRRNSVPSTTTPVVVWQAVRSGAVTNSQAIGLLGSRASSGGPESREALPRQRMVATRDASRALNPITVGTEISHCGLGSRGGQPCCTSKSAERGAISDTRR